MGERLHGALQASSAATLQQPAPPHRAARALPQRRAGDARRGHRARRRGSHRLVQHHRGALLRPRRREATPASRSSTSCASRISPSTSSAASTPSRSRCGSRAARRSCSRCGSWPTARTRSCCCRATSRRRRSLEIMRRDFVANVSHELKTPLTVVSGFLETIADGNVTLEEPRGRQVLGLMRSQTDRMLRLIDDLLTLSALESSAHAGARDGDRRAGAAAARSPRRRARSRAARHTIVLEPGPAATLWGDEREVRSAIANLVSNAVRYTPQGRPHHARLEPSATARAGSRRGHRHRHRDRATFRGSPSASIASTPAARARPAAPGSGSRS